MTQSQQQQQQQKQQQTCIHRSSKEAKYDDHEKCHHHHQHYQNVTTTYLNSKQQHQHQNLQQQEQRRRRKYMIRFYFLLFFLVQILFLCLQGKLWLYSTSITTATLPSPSSSSATITSVLSTSAATTTTNDMSTMETNNKDNKDDATNDHRKNNDNLNDRKKRKKRKWKKNSKITLSIFYNIYLPPNNTEHGLSIVSEQLYEVNKLRRRIKTLNTEIERTNNNKKNNNSNKNNTASSVAKATTKTTTTAATAANSDNKNSNGKLSNNEIQLYYTQIGNTKVNIENNNNNNESCMSCQRIYNVEDGDEMLTLQALYDYCIEKDSIDLIGDDDDNTEHRVVYIHTKGSFTDTIANDKLRKLLMNGTLSDACIQKPIPNPNQFYTRSVDACNVCSTQFNVFPVPHTVGNMFVADCNYISKLLPPNVYAKEKQRILFENIVSKEKRTTLNFLKDYQTMINPTTTTTATTTTTTATTIASIATTAKNNENTIKKHKKPRNLAQAIMWKLQSLWEGYHKTNNNNGNTVNVRRQQQQQEDDKNNINYSLMERTEWQLKREPWIGSGRYAMEHWVYSHPDVQPCDVYHGPTFGYSTNIPLVKNIKKPMSREARPRYTQEIYLNRRSLEYHPWFLLPGRLYEWKQLYNKIPSKTSWVWTYYTR